MAFTVTGVYLLERHSKSHAKHTCRYVLPFIRLLAVYIGPQRQVTCAYQQLICCCQLPRLTFSSLPILSRLLFFFLFPASFFFCFVPQSFFFLASSIFPASSFFFVLIWPPLRHVSNCCDQREWGCDRQEEKTAKTSPLT